MIKEDYSFVIPTLVLLELLAGEKYYGDVRPYCAQLVDNYELLTHNDIEKFSSLSPKTRAAIKAIDSAILVIAQRKKAKIASFDKKLLHFAKKEGIDTIRI
ncbi:MAG: hypothetical protein ACOCXP_00165 [Candidatus Dojkabacteria bacterium]